MLYRHRLRSRIILSFTLLGFLLTSLFACSVLLLRSRLESQLIEKTLQHEVEFIDSSVVLTVAEIPHHWQYWRTATAESLSNLTPDLVMSPVLAASRQTSRPMPSPCSGSWPVAT